MAAGGFATGADGAAALTAGAGAAAYGTAFLLCPEAGTSPVHRHALVHRRVTTVTRASTGRSVDGAAAGGVVAGAALRRRSR